MIEDKYPKTEIDEIMTVEEAANYMKTTSANVYNLVEKGRLLAVDFSSVDRPGARKLISIRKSEIGIFLWK